MSEMRYAELKWEGQIYTEQWKIDEILIKNKFNWMVNAEIKNARLEIFQDTLVWNAGIWYNGDWYFGVWRDGEWKYGTWQNGVWYNGVWRNGTFKSGIIYKGKFFKGKIESGEIRGGQFIDCEIDPKVVEYTSDEFQEQQSVQNTQPTQPEQPGQVKVRSSPPAQQEAPLSIKPKIQQENNTYNMKKIKTFEKFVNESTGDLEDMFVDIDIDETDLDRKDGNPQVKQKPGKILIETPSKTDAYNMKMSHGGIDIVDPKYPEKQILTIKDKK